MQFVVEAASVADGLAIVVPPPQRRVGRLAVGADRALPSGRRLRQKKQHCENCV